MHMFLSCFALAKSQRASKLAANCISRRNPAKSLLKKFGDRASLGVIKKQGGIGGWSVQLTMTHSRILCYIKKFQYCACVVAC